MLTAGKDFVVENEHGIIRCKPKTPECTSAFKVLQLAAQKFLPQVPDAPPVAIEIDGVIGPSVVLAVQAIAQRLAQGKHPELAQIAVAQPEDAIPAVASMAFEISGYIDRALQDNPTAIVSPPPTAEAPKHPLDGLREIFTLKRVLAGTATLLGIGAIVVLGAMANRRGLGVVDRSSFLPPSDGSDEFEDDVHDDDDHEAPTNYIDTTATEVQPAA